MVRRRRFLLGLAAATTVAGCTDASSGSSTDADEDASGDGSTATTTGASTATTTGSAGSLYTVDVAGNTDGSVSVSDTEIAFTDPVEMTWAVQGFQNGRPVTGGESGSGTSTGTATQAGPPLSVSRELDPTDDSQHAFATPIYDADADRFELWFYVDGTYRNAHDQHYVVWGPARTMDLQSREASFTEVATDIYRATVTYDEPVSADMAFPTGVLLDRPYSEVTPAGESRPEYTAVGVRPRVNTTASRAPQISFEFEYDESAGEVTITHQAGDSVQGSALQILVAGEPAEASFSGEVTAGDSVTVDVSSVASESELRVVWESPDGDSSATLALYQLP